MENEKNYFGASFVKAFNTAAADKDRGNVLEFVKSNEFVMWQSEYENACEACKTRNGRLYGINELDGVWPAHKNCKCKLVCAAAVKDNKFTINVLSNIKNQFIIGSENLAIRLLYDVKAYDNADMRLPVKKGRRYFKISANGKNYDYYVVSNDGLCFAAGNGNLYPVENTDVTRQLKAQKEKDFISSFRKETDIFMHNKMAPMAYTYLMKNIYDWYIADDAAQRTMIEQRLKAFEKTGYKSTGIPSYDDGIKNMPKTPDFISDEQHYFRNTLNIQYEWDDFEKLNKKLPAGYKWVKMSYIMSSMHQNTAELPEKPNKKFVSFDGKFELVYSYDNRLLDEETGSEDMGTYNYGSPLENGLIGTVNAWQNHLLKDMVTYRLYQNTKKDAQKKKNELMEDIKNDK